MKEFHVFYAPYIATNKELPHDEAQHITKVLRMKEGEEIIITDGKGSFYKAALSLVTNSIVAPSYYPKRAHAHCGKTN